MSVPEPDENGKRWYGVSGRKCEEDPTRCAELVWTNDRWPTCNQCTRKRGHGPDGLYCKQHDPAAVQARREEASRAYQEKMDRQNRPFRERVHFRRALEDIANGHNDPMTLAKQVLEEFK
jgi:hypothetical protein